MTGRVNVRFPEHDKRPIDYPSYNIRDVSPEEQARMNSLFRVIKPRTQPRKQEGRRG